MTEKRTTNKVEDLKDKVSGETVAVLDSAFVKEYEIRDAKEGGAFDQANHLIIEAAQKYAEFFAEEISEKTNEIEEDADRDRLNIEDGVIGSALFNMMQLSYAAMCSVLSKKYDGLNPALLAHTISMAHGSMIAHLARTCGSSKASDAILAAASSGMSDGIKNPGLKPHNCNANTKKNETSGNYEAGGDNLN